MDPGWEDRYLALQRSTLAEIVERSPPAAAPGATLDPMAAARAAFDGAIHGVGRGAPIADLARDAARWAGREPRPGAGLDALHEIVNAQPFVAVPGAREQLPRLHAEGFRVVVVSNRIGETGSRMRGVLQRLGLAPYLDGWTSSDEVPWAKPSPEIFGHAPDPLGARADEAVHIGDLAADIEGARSAGLRGAVRFRGARAYGAEYAASLATSTPVVPPADHILDDCRGLPAILASYFPATGRGAISR
ncbi:MAG: HAD family hydrolase [Thermoplasmata archaeon]